MDPFCYMCFVSYCLALWSPARKGLTSVFSCMWCFLVFLSLFHIPIYCLGSGVLVDL